MKINSCLLLLLFLALGCDDNDSKIVETPPYDYLQSQDLRGTAWEMDYSMEIHGDTSFRHVPKHWLRIKTFTKNRMAFTGYDFEKKEIAGIGGGTYTLNDSIYVEHIEFHHRSDFNGTEFSGKLYFDSLYLYQSGTVGELILKERWHRID